MFIVTYQSKKHSTNLKLLYHKILKMIEKYMFMYFFSILKFDFLNGLLKIS